MTKMMAYYAQDCFLLYDSVLQDWRERDSYAGLEEANNHVINCLWRRLHDR